MSLRPVPITVEFYPVRRNWVRLAARAVLFCALAGFTAGVIYQTFFS
jgi:hypothetical protein